MLISSRLSTQETTEARWDHNHNVLARGYFLVARGLQGAQGAGSGGVLVFVPSKDAAAAGKHRSYSTARAAELLPAPRMAEESAPASMRANTLRPLRRAAGR